MSTERFKNVTSFVINLLNNKTIILLNLADYRLILADEAVVSIRRYSARFRRIIVKYKEPLDQSDCWKLFVQLWNYTNYRYYAMYILSVPLVLTYFGYIWYRILYKFEMVKFLWRHKFRFILFSIPLLYLTDHTVVSPLNVIATLNVIPTVNVIKINYQCNANHKCNENRP